MKVKLQVHGCERDLASRRDIPGDLPTLDWARPGQELEIRQLLAGAESRCGDLRPYEVVTCRARSAGEIVIERRYRDADSDRGCVSDSRRARRPGSGIRHEPKPTGGL